MDVQKELEIFLVKLAWEITIEVSFTSEIDDHHLWNLGEMVSTQIGGRQLPNRHWFRPLAGTSCRKSCDGFVMGIFHYKNKG